LVDQGGNAAASERTLHWEREGEMVAGPDDLTRVETMAPQDIEHLRRSHLDVYGQHRLIDQKQFVFYGAVNVAIHVVGAKARRYNEKRKRSKENDEPVPAT